MIVKCQRNYEEICNTQSKREPTKHTCSCSRSRSDRTSWQPKQKATKSMKIEMELLTSQSRLMGGLATWENAIRYRQQKQDTLTNKTIPQLKRQQVLALASFKIRASWSAEVAALICFLRWEGGRKESASKRRGGRENNTVKTATQKSAMKPSQKRGSS